MGWIDERLEQRKKLMIRNGTVANGAEGLFNDLWKEVFALTTEATEKGLTIRTNGSSFERTIWTSNYPMSRGEQQLRIELNRENEKVFASWGEESIEFSLDVCDDNVVCLKRNGKPLLIQEAARAILDPFLFPELQATNRN